MGKLYNVLNDIHSGATSAGREFLGIQPQDKIDDMAESFDKSGRWIPPKENEEMHSDSVQLERDATTAMATAWAFAEMPPGHPKEKPTVDEFVQKAKKLPLMKRRSLFKEAVEGLPPMGSLRSISPRADSLLCRTAIKEFEEANTEILREYERFKNEHPIRHFLGFRPQFAKNNNA